jgi:hypothetical protein
MQWEEREEVIVIPACSWLESSLFEVLDPSKKHAGVTGWGDFI